MLRLIQACVAQYEQIGKCIICFSGFRTLIIWLRVKVDWKPMRICHSLLQMIRVLHGRAPIDFLQWSIDHRAQIGLQVNIVWLHQELSREKIELRIERVPRDKTVFVHQICSQIQIQRIIHQASAGQKQENETNQNWCFSCNGNLHWWCCLGLWRIMNRKSDKLEE